MTVISFYDIACQINFKTSFLLVCISLGYISCWRTETPGLACEKQSKDKLLEINEASFGWKQDLKYTIKDTRTGTQVTTDSLVYIVL